MSGLDLICFRITRPRNMLDNRPLPRNRVKRFYMRDPYDEFIFKDVYRRGTPIDWSSSDPEFLTENLNNLSWMAKWNLQDFEGSCKDPGNFFRIILQKNLITV